MTTTALSMRNPSDIESFTLLKHAVCTAIYGCRAAIGVFYVTYKKGRRSKVTVTLNAQLGLYLRVENKLDMMNADQNQPFTQLVTSVGLKDPGDAAVLQEIADNMLDACDLAGSGLPNAA